VPPQAEDEMRPSLAFFLCLVAPALLVMLFGCGGGSSSTAINPPPGGPPALDLSAFVGGLASPVGMEVPNDGTGRLFVLEQGGRIRIIQNGALVATPFLDITSKLESGGEKGLLGLAFHPSFSSNRRFFVYYTQRLSLQLQSVFSEYAASSSNPNQADASSERILLVVNQPFDNHNGGQLAFGPDGFLYIGTGDGGSEGDPQGNGQNLQTLLGKILRIDVDGAVAQTIRDPGGQSFHPAQRLARDLGLRSAQSLALFF
jgi:glucose/arabinose dehydrogenase